MNNKQSSEKMNHSMANEMVNVALPADYPDLYILSQHVALNKNGHDKLISTEDFQYMLQEKTDSFYMRNEQSMF